MNYKIQKAGTLEFAGFCILFILLFILKVYKIPVLGLPDYDSVKSFQVATEIAQGNFANLYRHASPGFNLFLAAQLKVFKNYVWAEYFNSGLILLATLIFTRFVSNEFKLKTFEALFLFAFIGSSLTLTFLGRSLTFDGFSFLLYILFLKHYYRAISQNKERQFYIAAFLYGLMFTVDYKVLLLLPIIILLLVYQRNLKVTFKQLLICVLIFLLVIGFFAFVGFLVSLPWYRYFVVAGIIPFKSDDHPNRVVGLFNSDILYYFKYLLFFENPLLIIGILLAPFSLNLKELLARREVNIVVFLVVFALCLFLGMSLIQKAPRGLLYAYPLLYTLAFLVCRKYLKRKLTLVLVLTGGLAFNIFAISRNIYQYTETNYSQIANYLQKQNIDKVAVTVSNRILPFLPPTIKIYEVARNEQLKALKLQGYEYLLVDDYYKITGIELELSPFKNVVLALKEPGLLNPILGLEHCEFAGFSFEEALEVNKELKMQETHLRLIKL